MLIPIHLLWHESLILMFDDHDLDERYKCDFDHSFTYERVSHAYDDLKTIDLGTVIGLEG